MCTPAELTDCVISDGVPKVRTPSEAMVGLLIWSGSDKAEALPTVSSTKEKSGEAGVVEDVQRVSLLGDGRRSQWSIEPFARRKKS